MNREFFCPCCGHEIPRFMMGFEYEKDAGTDAHTFKVCPFCNKEYQSPRVVYIDRYSLIKKEGEKKWKR